MCMSDCKPAFSTLRTQCSIFGACSFALSPPGHGTLTAAVHNTSVKAPSCRHQQWRQQEQHSQPEVGQPCCGHWLSLALRAPGSGRRRSRKQPLQTLSSSAALGRVATQTTPWTSMSPSIRRRWSKGPSIQRFLEIRWTALSRPLPQGPAICLPVRPLSLLFLRPCEPHSCMCDSYCRVYQRLQH